jgi:Protein of unknown function (DUF1588)/Protein of unknown function (DUF1592)/Protein of unknown function (DUF1595)/Protein of unknown function (DUF1587)
MKVVVCTLLALAGCVGQFGALARSRPTVDEDSSAQTLDPDECGADSEPLVEIPARVRRLTAREFQATTQSLIGIDTPSIDFVADPSSKGFDNSADALRVTSTFALQLWNEVPALASRALATLASEQPCVRTDASCAQSALLRFAERAYRRPLSPVERKALSDTFAAGAEDATPEDGTITALTMVLQAPALLYHSELGDGVGDRMTLRPYEAAEALAYTLTGGPPDKALLDDAASAAILEPDVRAAHVERLLATPSAENTLGYFFSQWLETAKLATLDRQAAMYPEWVQVRAAVADDVRATLVREVLSHDLGFQELFTARLPLSDTLAQTYAGDRGGGVLALPSVLASHAQSIDPSPVRRGHFVRSRIFCQEMPPPPPSLMVTSPAPDPSRTNRERFAANSANPTCQGCHALMDPLGFGFEHYDAIGRYREVDNGKNVDATGEVTGTDVDGPYDGLAALGEKISASRVARGCFVTHFMSFMNAAALETRARCRAYATVPSFAREGGSMRQMLIEYYRSRTFITRTKG